MEKMSSDPSGRLVKGGVLVDVKSALNPMDLPESMRYWSL
jgi:hypothetical protein